MFFFYQILANAIYGRIENSHKNNKSKISAPTLNEKLELPKGSYFVSNIQDDFEYIIKKTCKND